MRDPISVVADTLQRIQLPSLTRPPLGPNHPPTLELVQFDLTNYAYSSLAYIRNLLQGYLALVALGNVTGLDLVTRGLFEWTMQASYVYLRTREPFQAKQYAACRELMDRIQSGNGWIKKHGDKYWKAPVDDDVPDSLRIKHLVKAYKEYQLQTRQSDSVEDDYGYLSEHAHPNGFCLADFRSVNGNVLSFVDSKPPARNRGLAVATILDWSMCILNILEMVQELTVRRKLIEMLHGIAQQ